MYHKQTKISKRGNWGFCVLPMIIKKEPSQPTETNRDTADSQLKHPREKKKEEYKQNLKILD